MLNVESKTLTETEIKALYQKFRATQKKLTAATLELKKRFEGFHEEPDEYYMNQSDEWIYESKEGEDFQALLYYYSTCDWFENEEEGYDVIPDEERKSRINPLVIQRLGLLDDIEEHRELDCIGDQLGDWDKHTEPDEYHKLERRYKALELICYPDER